VSFAQPLALLALLALPFLAAIYAIEQRNRRAGAAAFAAPPVQPSVAPERPGWRRHAPMVVAALALAVLIVAAAKPQRTVAVPVERASIVLATDVSGSMTARDLQPTRLAAAKQAALRFVNAVPARVNIGVLSFNGAPTILQNPTRDRDAARAAIDGMTPSGATATGEAIAAGVTMLRPNGAEKKRLPPAAILLLSDGTSTRGRDPVTVARTARQAQVRVYTVALGTDRGTITVTRRDGSTYNRTVPPDPASLAQIARVSGGKAYTAESANRLEEIYQQLGSKLGHKDQKRQITSVFAGGGLALLLVGMAMSMRWFGRFI
jgi:Ca-activated chloride channel family protein